MRSALCQRSSAFTTVPQGTALMASVTSFLGNRLRLTVKRQKSAIVPVGEGQFLGHGLGREGKLGIGRKSLACAKDRLREITHRNRGDCSLGRMVEPANCFIMGWVTCYRHAQCKGTLRDLDGRLRCNLRCVRLQSCKSFRTMVDFLPGHGVTRTNAFRLAESGKSWWRLTDSHQAKQAMPVARFDALGLVGMANHHGVLRLVGNRRVRDPYAHGVRGARREASPYSIAALHDAGRGR